MSSGRGEDKGSAIVGESLQLVDANPMTHCIVCDRAEELTGKESSLNSGSDGRGGSALISLT